MAFIGTVKSILDCDKRIFGTIWDTQKIVRGIADITSTLFPSETTEKVGRLVENFEFMPMLDLTLEYMGVKMFVFTDVLKFCNHAFNPKKWVGEPGAQHYNYLTFVKLFCNIFCDSKTFFTFVERTTGMPIGTIIKSIGSFTIYNLAPGQIVEFLYSKPGIKIVKYTSNAFYISEQIRVIIKNGRARPREILIIVQKVVKAIGTTCTYFPGVQFRLINVGSGVICSGIALVLNWYLPD